MTYFAFLFIFLGIPIALLSLWTIADYRRGHWMPAPLAARRPWVVLLGLCIVAFVYTTPWDNYLVATGVWWYDIDLVTGIVIGYVPIEEYTFFLVQPVFTGLFLLALMRYMAINPSPASNFSINRRALLLVMPLWVISVILLILSLATESFAGFTYLSLEVSWALIPVMIQLAFGADILWRHRRIIAIAIATTTIYLSAADSLAIGAGTWTIDPAQSLNIYLGGVLPIEEFIFFLLTNILVVFGITLVLAQESQVRVLILNRFAFMRPLIQRIAPQANQLDTLSEGLR